MSASRALRLLAERIEARPDQAGFVRWEDLAELVRAAEVEAEGFEYDEYMGDDL